MKQPTSNLKYIFHTHLSKSKNSHWYLYQMQHLLAGNVSIFIDFLSTKIRNLKCDLAKVHATSIAKVANLMSKVLVSKMNLETTHVRET